VESILGLHQGHHQEVIYSGSGGQSYGTISCAVAATSGTSKKLIMTKDKKTTKKNLFFMVVEAIVFNLVTLIFVGQEQRGVGKS